MIPWAAHFLFSIKTTLVFREKRRKQAKKAKKLQKGNKPFGNVGEMGRERGEWGERLRKFKENVIYIIYELWYTSKYGDFDRIPGKRNCQNYGGTATFFSIQRLYDLNIYRMDSGGSHDTPH